MRSNDTKELARCLRRHALQMTHRARTSHIGSCLSMADILAVLYGGFSGWRRRSPPLPTGTG